MAWLTTIPAHRINIFVLITCYILFFLGFQDSFGNGFCLPLVLDLILGQALGLGILDSLLLLLDLHSLLGW